MSAAVNEPVGKYRYLLELGQGGTANVYLAVARGPSGFSKLVVMKTLKPSLASEVEFVRMFRTEARLAARLSHPNIVQTNEVTEDGTAPSIVMEYLEGQPLSSVLARSLSSMPLMLHLRVILDVLTGLEYAHELLDYDGTPLSLVHRDVTPHNVFVTFDGQVKLLDFGIAKIATEGPDTQTGVIKGKARYIPPEQIAGTPIDRRADVFAVGVMLWEALVGDRMWKSQSDVTVMNRVLTGNIPSPSVMRPEVSPALDQICRKALSANRNDRYATAAEFEADLEAAIRAVNGLTPPTNRELGKYVSELFADVRYEIRRTIDTQLRDMNVLSWDDYHARVANPPAMALPVRPPSESRDQPLEGATSTAHAANLAIGTKPWHWALCGAGLLGFVALMWRISEFAVLPARASNPHPLAAASSVPSAHVAASRQQETFHVRLEAVPSEAKLFLDGNALPANPYTQSLPRGKYLLRVEAEGYVTTSETLTLEQDAEVRLELRPKKAHAPPESLKQSPRKGRGALLNTPKAKAERPSPSSAATPLASCSMPYLVDSRGIKRIKPECM